MFGYFRLNQRLVTDEIRKTYKKYYCGLCFALERNYGEKARLLLSYDVVMLGLLGDIRGCNQWNNLPCFRQKNRKRQFKNEKWKKLAAINILLVNAKIDDDIHDENSMKAKLGYIFFVNQIRKARREYPELSKIINNGYKEMLKKEREGGEVLEICDIFAEMMVTLLKEAFHADLFYLNILFHISRWLYFVDQIDDYDSDLKKHKINVLHLPGVDKDHFTNLYHDKLLDYLTDILGEILKTKEELDRSVMENQIIYSILDETIPRMTLQAIVSEEK